MNKRELPVRFSERLNGWYIDDPELGSSMYDTEDEALADRDLIASERAMSER